MAVDVADTFCVLVHGEVAASGPAAELRDSRALMEATYLGS